LNKSDLRIVIKIITGHCATSLMPPAWYALQNEKDNKWQMQSMQRSNQEWQQ
jgi:hypothetical protein